MGPFGQIQLPFARGVSFLTLSTDTLATTATFDPDFFTLTHEPPDSDLYVSEARVSHRQELPHFNRSTPYYLFGDDHPSHYYFNGGDQPRNTADKIRKVVKEIEVAIGFYTHIFSKPETSFERKTSLLKDGNDLAHSLATHAVSYIKQEFILPDHSLLVPTIELIIATLDKLEYFYELAEHDSNLLSQDQKDALGIIANSFKRYLTDLSLFGILLDSQEDLDDTFFQQRLSKLDHPRALAVADGIQIDRGHAEILGYIIKTLQDYFLPDAQVITAQNGELLLAGKFKNEPASWQPNHLLNSLIDFLGYQLKTGDNTFVIKIPSHSNQAVVYSTNE